ncbi:MAG: hypothetical protein Q9165_000218 [Trypethelium subeluteriae]
MDVWSGNIYHKNEVIRDIHLSTSEQNHANDIFPSDTTLHFLSLINVNYVPLYMVNGPNLGVWTTIAETTIWFETFFYLFGTPDSPERQSPISEEQLQEHLSDSHEQLRTGILTRVEYGENVEPTNPRTTEIVFYLSQPIADAERFPASLPQMGHPFRARFGEYRVHALPLSSDLLKAIQYRALDPPPLEVLTKEETSTSDDPSEQIEGQFLEPVLDNEHLEQALKRKRTASLFEEATERRRKAKRHGGESIALAASKHSQQDSIMQSTPLTESQTQDRREPIPPAVSNGAMRPPPGHSRTRSTSIPNASGPSSARDSHLPMTPDAAIVSLVEERNKETISRVVMAGLRLYGLSSRSRKPDSRRQSVGLEVQPVQGKDGTPVPSEADTYKLVYHQAYKGAVFAFRQYMRDKLLHLQTEKVREVVDRLLAVFCCDPLEDDSGAAHEDQELAGTGRREPENAEVPASPSRVETEETLQQPNTHRRDKTAVIDTG